MKVKENVILNAVKNRTSTQVVLYAIPRNARNDRVIAGWLYDGKLIASPMWTVWCCAQKPPMFTGGRNAQERSLQVCKTYGFVGYGLDHTTII